MDDRHADSPTPFVVDGQLMPGLQSMAGAERVVYHVLKSGLARLASNINAMRGHGDLIDVLFPHFGAKERDTVRRLICERRPKVVHGYPRSNAEMPAIMVLVTNESENRRFVGDTLDDGGEDAPEFIGHDGGTYETKGVLVDASIDCWVMDDNPDVVQAFYTIVWNLLDSARTKVFAKRDLNIGSLSGGDVPPDSNYMPEYVFVRRCGMTITGVRLSAFGDELWDGIGVELDIALSADPA